MEPTPFRKRFEATLAEGGRSHCRFRNRGTDFLSESGITRVSGSAKRQCDRALPGGWRQVDHLVPGDAVARDLRHRVRAAEDAEDGQEVDDDLPGPETAALGG